MKIAIIGAGNMGNAIVCGLGSSSIRSELEICCADLATEKLSQIKAAYASIHVTTDNREAVKEAAVVIIAVEPKYVEAVIKEIKESLDYKYQMIVSIGTLFEIIIQRMFLIRKLTTTMVAFPISMSAERTQ